MFAGTWRRPRPAALLNPSWTQISLSTASISPSRFRLSSPKRCSRGPIALSLSLSMSALTLPTLTTRCLLPIRAPPLTSPFSPSRRGERRGARGKQELAVDTRTCKDTTRLECPIRLRLLGCDLKERARWTGRRGVQKKDERVYCKYQSTQGD